MDWGELKVLFAHKQREAQVFTRWSRPIADARERRSTWRSIGSRLMGFLQTFVMRNTPR